MSQCLYYSELLVLLGFLHVREFGRFERFQKESENGFNSLDAMDSDTDNELIRSYICNLWMIFLQKKIYITLFPHFGAV